MTHGEPVPPASDREGESAPSLTPPAPSTSDLVGAALGEAAKRAGLDPSEGAATGHVVWRAMGGWRGILESVLPSLVFVVLFTLTYDRTTQTGNLWLSLGLSVGSGRRLHDRPAGHEVAAGRRDRRARRDGRRRRAGRC